MEKFPVLYGKNKNGKIKNWEISVINSDTFSVINIKYGQIDGKKCEQNVQINLGKNLNKKNATNHFTQALLDAKSKWENKIKSGYKESIESLNEIEQIKLPMLANDYFKHSKKVKFPCVVQPKLDGYRCIFQNGKCYSRTGKEYKILEHSNIFKELQDVNVILDGEIYVHNNFKFEDYGILRKEKIDSEDLKVLELMTYYIYDIINDSKFKDKILQLQNICKNKKYIKLVENIICNDESEFESIHDNLVENNYEGIMIRNLESVYKEKYRSFDLLKYKKFDDNEFTIKNFTIEKDTNLGEPLIVWICITDTGKEFKVQSTGNVKERQELYKNAEKYIGKKLWVKYFGLTNIGIPRFPKTKMEGIKSIREEIN